MSLVHSLRALTATAILVAPGLVTLPVVQVLLVNVVTPRFTLTMADRSLDGLGAPGGPWIDSVPVAVEHGGHLPLAAVSSEDGWFYVHSGFDWYGICAAWQSNQDGGRLRGGSTITQQTARNVFLFQRRSWIRKGLEVGYTVLLETFVSKDRILELYLNVAETGNRRFGFQAAARETYDRDVADLTPQMAARLVYLLPNPRQRDPRSRDAGKKASWILKNLAPVPGQQGHERQVERWNERPWWPLCP